MCANVGGCSWIILLFVFVGLMEVFYIKFIGLSIKKSRMECFKDMVYYRNYVCDKDKEEDKMMELLKFRGYIVEYVVGWIIDERF